MKLWDCGPQRREVSVASKVVISLEIARLYHHSGEIQPPIKIVCIDEGLAWVHHCYKSKRKVQVDKQGLHQMMLDALCMNLLGSMYTSRD